MTRSIYDPIVDDVSPERREKAQEDFGRHVVELRNRMAKAVRKWIETDAKFPIPIYDRLIDRIRQLPPETRADVASISLLMADQIVSAVLIAFAGSDDMRAGERLVNYAIIAQSRDPGSHDVVEEIDINRGEPIASLWDRYKKWLSRFAPSDLRPMGEGRGANE